MDKHDNLVTREDIQKDWNRKLKLVSAIFYEIFVFHQIIVF